MSASASQAQSSLHGGQPVALCGVHRAPRGGTGIGAAALRATRSGRDADVLVTMLRRGPARRLRAVSPDSRCRGRTPPPRTTRAPTSYAGNPPRDLARAPRLTWAQLHMAGVNALHDHPIFAAPGVALTTSSGVHAAAIAEYAVTMLLRWRTACPAWSSGRGGELAARRAALAHCSWPTEVRAPPGSSATGASGASWRASRRRHSA